MQKLLDKFNLNNTNFLLIFDVDGTLRPDTVDCLDHRHPKIHPDTARQLMELNTLDKVTISILTARSYVDIYRSNLPKNITKYCGFGKQIVESDILRYPREDFHRAYDEITMFIDLLKDILGPKLTINLDFLMTPGDFAIYFESDNYHEQKKKIMEIIEIVLFNSKRWSIMDLGKELVFKDAKYPYDKGDSIVDILNNTNLKEATQVFFFGDSNDDYKAMEALRTYQKSYPQKRIKVNNVCVGPALMGREFVDVEFQSYKDTLHFVSELHDKLFS
jgi:hydroxymethylpyrimidine pyrophosphatase-like HAD family hydrolase